MKNLVFADEVLQYTKVLDAMTIKGDLTPEERALTTVRTVDGSQGCSFDLDILDFVQTFRPGFTTNSHRICVSLTRARAAEVVLMCRGAVVDYQGDSWSSAEGDQWDLLHRIYDPVAADKGIVTLRKQPLPTVKSSEVRV